MTQSGEPLIPKHGGYRSLKSFQIAQLVYDVTARFCERYVNKHSRTYDQMIQAARSGTQNIAEGSEASGTSKKMEIKLTNVAKASLEELRLDYEDYLRHRKLPIWPREDPRRQMLIDQRPKTVEDVVAWTRKIHAADNQTGCGRGGPSGRSGQKKPSTTSTTSTTSTASTASTKSTYPEIAANGALTLIAVASALLHRQIAAQARCFETDGGFTERLYDHRQVARKKK